jgi:hypothetical protein
MIVLNQAEVRFSRCLCCESGSLAEKNYTRLKSGVHDIGNGDQWEMVIEEL